MALILLRRGSSSSSSVSTALRIRNRLFASRFQLLSTCSANGELSRATRGFLGRMNSGNSEEVQNLKETASSKSSIPDIPIPDGFPFSIIEEDSYSITFAREDKEETAEIYIPLYKCQLTNGIPSIEMYTCIFRGYWHMMLKVIAGPKTIRIREVHTRKDPGRHLRCFDEFLDSKGLNAGTINNLFSFFKEKMSKTKMTEADES